MLFRFIALVLGIAVLGFGSSAKAASLSEALGILEEAPASSLLVESTGLQTLFSGQTGNGVGGGVAAALGNAGGSACQAPTFSCCRAPISCGGAPTNVGRSVTSSGCFGGLTIQITVNLNINLNAACSRPTASACCCSGF